MSELDPAHVEAVARAQLSSPWPKGSLGEWATNERAERLLTSTDPAVHAALLAALVRAGVLEEDRTWAYIQNRSTGPCEMHSGFGRAPSRTPGRRFVTRWEDVECVDD